MDTQRVWRNSIPFSFMQLLKIKSHMNFLLVAIVSSYEWTYNVKFKNFLDRWTALGNRAIVISE
jgi:hypothetical protein